MIRAQLTGDKLVRQLMFYQILLSLGQIFGCPQGGCRMVT